MSIEQLLISLSGLALTIITIVAAAIRYSKQVAKMDVENAQKRGALEQRMSEAEQDIDSIGQRMRGIEGGQQILEQAQAATTANITALGRSIEGIDKKVDYLIRLHMKADHT